MRFEYRVNPIQKQEPSLTGNQYKLYRQTCINQSLHNKSLYSVDAGLGIYG